jgi:fumarylacetoacetase
LRLFAAILFMYEINETHDPSLKSWVESANLSDTDFPIQNLPFCHFLCGSTEDYLGVVIGDQVLSLRRAVKHDLLGPEPQATDPNVLWANTVDAVMGSNAANLFRKRVSSLLDVATTEDIRNKVAECLIPRSRVEFSRPLQYIGDYTDFYCSIYHATNVGSMFRPENPLLPNYMCRSGITGGLRRS